MQIIPQSPIVQTTTTTAVAIRIAHFKYHAPSKSITIEIQFVDAAGGAFGSVQTLTLTLAQIANFLNQTANAGDTVGQLLQNGILAAVSNQLGLVGATVQPG